MFNGIFVASIDECMMLIVGIDNKGSSIEVSIILNCADQFESLCRISKNTNHLNSSNLRLRALILLKSCKLQCIAI